MAHERTYPCLPCADLDASIAFYESLGFVRTYRQLRPNPYAVVVLEDLQIHLFGMPDFDPQDSYGSVIVAVPDPDLLYSAFAERLRAAYGKLPVAGLPRILRPRKKYGTVRGFSVVDPGGNWLRIYKLGDTEQQDPEDQPEGLAKIIEVAARLGDAHGDAGQALATLEAGLARYPAAPALDRARAQLYRAELAVRLDMPERAAASLEAAASVSLTEAERAVVEQEFADATELVRGLPSHPSHPDEPHQEGREP
jgi:catechol 2,3-dioxygenase-like lactoylglutathione lyase family enzyme